MIPSLTNQRPPHEPTRSSKPSFSARTTSFCESSAKTCPLFDNYYVPPRNDVRISILTPKQMFSANEKIPGSLPSFRTRREPPPSSAVNRQQSHFTSQSLIDCSVHAHCWRATHSPHQSVTVLRVQPVAFNVAHLQYQSVVKHGVTAQYHSFI